MGKYFAPTNGAAPSFDQLIKTRIEIRLDLYKSNGVDMALMLGRKKGQSVTVTHEALSDIELVIQVSRIEHGQVKLSFEGPKDFRILRNELTDGRERH